MPEEKSEKTFILKPSWKHFFVPYLLSILAIPILGLGLVTLYYVWKKHRSIRYEVTDARISSVDAKIHRTFDLINIERVELEQNWLRDKLDVATLVLHTPASEMHLIGMTHPERLRKMLLDAIDAEIQRHQQQVKTKPREPDYEPGSMDRMDYLTGLWQQGLLSNEDFEDERKHFE